MDLMRGNEAMVIISTAPPERAQGMAQALVEQRLAACVNIMPVRSVYRWKGEICDEMEEMMVIKTSRDRMGEVMEALRRMHPYELPELIALRPAGGYAPYLEWVRSETAP